jgi:Methane oxygenase PmoA
LGILTLAFASSVFAQTWQWALSTSTDSLKRSFQPMRVEIPAAQFEPALPKDPVRLYGQLQMVGEAGTKTSQVLWSKTDPSKVVVMWMEESLLPQKAYNYQLTITQAPPSVAAIDFKLTKADSGIDVAHGANMVYRYQDVYDAANYGETRKPFNHVYGTDGKYITKGNEGEHPHQRGIFMGWSINDHGYWTDAGGTVQIHKSYDSSVAVMGPVFSRVASTISWQHNKVEEIVETRTVEAWWIKPGVTLLDFRFVLTEPQGKSFSLDGEGAHAGMQFRAGDEVNVNRMDSALSAHQFSQDGPIKAGYNYIGKGHWIAQLFPIRGIKYLAMVMDHLDNPKPTEFPTRDYGRFGVFFNHVQPAGAPLPLYYRFLITDRSVQDTAGIGTAYNSFQYPPVVKAVKGTVGLARGAAPFSRSAIDPALGIRMAGRELRLNGSQPVQVSLYNLVGKSLLSQDLTVQSPMSLESIPKGLVWIQVRGSFGVRTQSYLMP